ncbi:MAG: protease complex subunit PrcB family protein [Lachnospiraceae bacterium]|nr:protease complex subunit PrcB family protein [Lachnospiraceae bacterium]
MRWGRGFVVILGCAGLLVGCQITKVENVRVKDLDYTVVKAADIPEPVQAAVEEHKAEEFQMTYEYEGFLYLLRGYGGQPTGGYSIKVLDVYLGEGAIYVETELLGPASAEEAKGGTSYPYVVLKMEEQEEPVLFQ